MEKIFNVSNPPVTIVLPVFNGGKTLGRCLSSIEALRDVNELRVVILDNCSGDQTLSIAKQYAANSRFQVDVLQNERNIGFLNSLKKILSISKTDFSLLLGHDDFVGKNYFLRLNGYRYSPLDTAIITTQVVSFDPDKDSIPHYVASRHRADGVYSSKYIVDNFTKKDDFGLAFLGMLNTRYFNSSLYDQILPILKKSNYSDLYLKGAFADIYSTLNVFGNKKLHLLHVDSAKVYKGVTKGSVGHESVIRNGIGLKHFEYLDMCHEVYVLSLPKTLLFSNRLALRSLLLAYKSYIKKLIFRLNPHGFSQLLEMTRRTFF